MIDGNVTGDGVPTVTLALAGRDWAATIDTGFNGDLELPEGLRVTLNARHVGRVTSELAGGQSIEEDAYLVVIPFDGRQVEAVATFVPGDGILIGTNLLRDHRLTVGFKSRTVRLRREGRPRSG